MRVAILIAAILLCCAPVQAQPDLGVLEWRTTLEVDASLRKKRRYYRVVRRVRPVVVQALPEPETRKVRIISIFCHDNAESFDDRWCHRVSRPLWP